MVFNIQYSLILGKLTNQKIESYGEISVVQYRDLCTNEICRELFKGFIRYQNVTKCWRKENNQWKIKDGMY